MNEPALADHYRLLRYHRAGFAGSDRIQGPISMADHAAYCARLMTHLGIDRAHILGHSSSAVIALQLALDFPAVAHTLTLMEPARPVPPTEEQAEFVREFVAPALCDTAPGTRPAPSIPSPAESSDRTTVARWTADSRAPSSRLELLSSWLPNVEPFELPNATHLLHVQNPRGWPKALPRSTLGTRSERPRVAL